MKKEIGTQIVSLKENKVEDSTVQVIYTLDEKNNPSDKEPTQVNEVSQEDLQKLDMF